MGNYPLVTPVDPVVNKTTRAPFRGAAADEEGNSPQAHATRIREHTHGLFDSGVASHTRQTGLLGSTTTTGYPHEDPTGG